MADSFGSGVSRTLSPLNKQLSNVIWQQGKPPLDSELNLIGQIGWDTLQENIQSQFHSGFLLDPSRSDEDFTFKALGSNFLELGEDNSITAIVNGWVIPISGSESSTASNHIKLGPPPTSNARTDIVILEVWRAIVSADPSVVNKPAADKLWKYGNVLYGGVDNPSDEMLDGAVGFETTKRVQVQHRLRVVDNIDLGTYPEGLGSPTVEARGPNGAAVGGMTFSNMEAEGDSGLWRAGDGDPTNALNTVDGYVYAIPVAAVFRRNTDPYQAISNGGAPNHNGAITRTPSSVDSSSARILTQATLTANLSNSAVGAISLTNLVGSGLDDAGLIANPPVLNATERFLFIGEGKDREVVAITAVDSGAGTVTISSRGRAGTQARSHLAGAQVSLHLSRPDGRYSDQIVRDDLIDLRHGVTSGDWDYNRLLEGAVADVIFNRLQTTFKTSGNGSDSKGPVVEEVVSLWSPQGNPQRQHTHLLDGPDGTRKVWSDAAVIQSGVTVLLDPANTPIDGDGMTTAQLNSTTANNWTTGADFNPTGFLYSDNTMRAGSTIFLNIGGQNNTSGVRKGIKSTLQNDLVRFIHPREVGDKAGGDKYPFRIQFFDMTANGTGNQTYSGSDFDDQYAGRFYAPSKAGGYSDGFVVLGEALESVNGLSVATVSVLNAAFQKFTHNVAGLQNKEIWAVNLGVTFDAAYGAAPVLNGTSTFYNLLTDNGRDVSGQSSELYLHVYGDPDTNNGVNNNGVFKIIGAGKLTPLSYKMVDDIGNLSGASTWVFCERLESALAFFATGSLNLRADIRTQRIDSRDNTLALVMTDSTLNKSGKLVVSSSLLWPPAQGGAARTPDEINTIALRTSGSEYLRNNAFTLDSDPASIPISSAEILLPSSNHISLLAELSSDADGMGGGGQTIGADADKTAEAFVDTGSKTLMIQPYQRQNMTLTCVQYINTNNTNPIGVTSTSYADGVTPKDGGGLLQLSDSVYPIPFEALPRFGRQDIPYHVRTSNVDPFLAGINHLFVDTSGNAADVFNLIGGEDNAGAAAVYPSIFATGGGNTYGQYVAPNLVAQQEGYVARKVTLNIPTSDLGSVTKGIEIPPFLGFARVYGVYERTDFDTNAQNARGAHEADRITPIANAPTNLLRTDATDFTLYIKENGGAEADLVSAADEAVGAHTYILTEHALDISRIAGFTAGETLDDYDFVVEAVVFGFALGFINENNLIVARKHNGAGTALAADGANPDISNVEMVFPSAVAYGEEIYAAYKRTVYQGDIFHTRDGATPQYADEAVRDGQIPPSESYKLSLTRDQLQPNGASAIEIINRRSMEVLASMDFYTTLGSGAIGGTMKLGKLTDIGFPLYAEGTDSGVAQRVADALTRPYPQTQLSAFTAPLTVSSTRDFARLRLYESYLTTYNEHANERLFLTVTDTSTGVSTNFDGTDGGANETWADFVRRVVTFFTSNGYEVIQTQTIDGVELKVLAPTLGDSSGRYTLSLGLGAVAGTYRLGGEEIVTRLYSGDSVESKTSVALSGGVTYPSNGGSGNIPISLVGMTSRLPLGILVSDHDFLCEDPLNNQASYLNSFGSQISSANISQVPPSDSGAPYTRVVGSVGELLQMGDGATLDYLAYSSTNPAGTQRYRIHRGGGAVFGAHGPVAGGPLTFLVDSFSSEQRPVVKGGVLACRAMLVRNFKEEGFTGANQSVRSHGDEIQLLIATYASFGYGAQALTIDGEISPSGYGEGYASADRYRVKGRPLVKIPSSAAGSVDPAPYSS